MLDGVDVAHHQKPTACNWVTAHDEAGVRFCFVKTTAGADYIDPAARDHLTRLAASPVVAGVYHFAYPANRQVDDPDLYAGGVAEAQHAVATADRFGAIAGHLPLALDLEWGGYKFRSKTNVDARDAFVRGFVDTVEWLTGRLPIVYSGVQFWMGGKNWEGKHSPELARELHDRGCRLWLIGYTRRGQPAREMSEWPWTFWQWSGGGPLLMADESLPGMPKVVDRNRARLTEGELFALAGIHC